MNPEIQPADVYAQVAALREQVRWLTGAVFVLQALVIMQIIAKAGLFGKVIRTLRKVEALVFMVEGHSKLTDSKNSRMLDTLAGVEKLTATTAKDAALQTQEAVKEVKQAVELVPDRTVEKLTGGDANGPVTPYGMATPPLPGSARYLPAAPKPKPPESDPNNARPG